MTKHITVLTFILLVIEVQALLNGLAFTYRYSSSIVIADQRIRNRPSCPTFQVRNEKRRKYGNRHFSTETPASDDQGEAFDFIEDDNFMNDLKLRIARSEVFGPGLGNRPKPREVFIVLFEKDTDNEGVHSIEFPKGSGSNVILAFESLTQCTFFSDSLKNQHFHNPEPTEILLQDLEDYCNPLGVEVQVVPEGTSLKPPSQDVDTFDHDPNYNQAKSKFESLLDISFEQNEEESGLIDPFSDESYGSWE